MKLKIITMTLTILGFLVPTVRAGEVRGTVIQEFAAGEFMIDLGMDHGLQVGTEVELFHQVTLVHPVTREKISDEIFLGVDLVSFVGKRVSVLKLTNVDPSRITVGAPVVVVTAHDLPSPSQVSDQTGTGDCRDKLDPALEEWIASLGTPIEQRSARIRVFLAVHPDSPHRDELLAELSQLELLIQLKNDAENHESSEAAAKDQVKGLHDPLATVWRGAFISPTVSVRSSSPLAGATLFLRSRPGAEFTAVAMKQIGPRAFTCELDPTMTSEDRLEYFIEGVRADQTRVILHGEAGSPQVVTTRNKPALTRGSRNRSVGDVSFELVDFYTKRPGRDQYWKMEAEYRYQLDFGLLEAFRIGFGVYQGSGASSWAIEENDADSYNSEKKSLAMTYSFMETELSWSRYFALIPRLIFGRTRDYVQGGEDDSRGNQILGYQFYLRFGAQDGVNLRMGTTTSDLLGIQARIAMNIPALRNRMPVGIAVEATNLPVDEDFGARLIGSLGWQGWEWMSIIGNFSVNMRNIDHIGLGGGLGLAFKW